MGVFHLLAILMLVFPMLDFLTLLQQLRLLLLRKRPLLLMLLLFQLWLMPVFHLLAIPMLVFPILVFLMLVFPSQLLLFLSLSFLLEQSPTLWEVFPSLYLLSLLRLLKLRLLQRLL